MQTDTVSIAQFVLAHGITMTSEWADSNPNMPSREMDHWKVTVRAGRKQMTTYFSQGFGHNGKEPNVYDVLDCLASDASGADESFEGFCSNFGYDTDSRKAEKIYKACKHSGERLKKFLGDDAFQTLVYGGVERL